MLRPEIGDAIAHRRLHRRLCPQDFFPFEVYNLDETDLAKKKNNDISNDNNKQ